MQRDAGCRGVVAANTPAGEPMHTEPEARALAVFTAVDARDAAAFADFFAPDGVFRFGNAPPCVGREAIREFVEGFFSALAGLEHRIEAVDAKGLSPGKSRLYYHLHVMYRTTIGATEWLPALVVADDTPAGFARYQIYSDPAPLHALLSTDGAA
jgi:ketosteroid isomerase-like protein